MDIEQLQTLVKLTEQGRLAVLELRRPGERVRLEGPAHLDGVAPSTLPAAPVPETKTQVTAPGFGHFIAQHPQRAEPFAGDGSVVKPGDILGLIQVDHLYLPVTCKHAGPVRCLATDQSLVGYGTPLFEIGA